MADTTSWSGGFWSASLQDITVESGSVLRSPASAILDTGTSMIVGPFEDVAYLADEIGATCVAFSGPDSSSVEEVRVGSQSVQFRAGFVMGGTAMPSGVFCAVLTLGF